MKKFTPLLTTLTLAVSTLATALPTYASIVIGEQEYWSADELAKFGEEAERARKETCGDDLTCQYNLYSQQWSGSLKGRAWRSFINDRFAVTAINPSAETIRIQYHDTDYTKKLTGSQNWRADLYEVFISWLEPGQSDPSTASSTINYRSYQWQDAELKNGIKNPNVHFLYYGSETEQGPGWFSANQEIEASVADANIANNESHILYANSYTGFVGSFDKIDYSSCLASPDYEEGMECRLLYNAVNKTTYEPFWPGEPTAERTPEVEPAPTTPELAAPIEPETTTPKEEVQTKPTQTEASAPVITSTEKAADLTAPLTGVAKTNTGNASQTGLVIMAIIISAAVFIWHFLPNRTKKSQKS